MHAIVLTTSLLIEYVRRMYCIVNSFDLQKRSHTIHIYIHAHLTCSSYVRYCSTLYLLYVFNAFGQKGNTSTTKYHINIPPLFTINCNRIGSSSNSSSNNNNNNNIKDNNSNMNSNNNTINSNGNKGLENTVVTKRYQDVQPHVNRVKI